jgi:hypothetical protein
VTTLEVATFFGLDYGIKKESSVLTYIFSLISDRIDFSVFLIYGFFIELIVLSGTFEGLLEIELSIFFSDVLLRIVDVEGLPLDRLALWAFLNLFSYFSISNCDSST